MSGGTSDEPAPPRVLLIEPDTQTAETIWQYLDHRGMCTAWAPTGEGGMTLKHSFAPEVVLVDLDLPDQQAVTLVEWLFGQRDCGVILLAAGISEPALVESLERGADDVIAKPVPLREAAARIIAVRRRVLLRHAAPRAVPAVHRVGAYTVDLQRRAVHDAARRPVPLTGAEFAALQALLEAAGAPVSRERLFEAALRRRWRPDDRSIDQLIFSLRRKLADQGGQRLIQSVRGAGYVLANDAPASGAAQPSG